MSTFGLDPKEQVRRDYDGYPYKVAFVIVAANESDVTNVMAEAVDKVRQACEDFVNKAMQGTRAIDTSLPIVTIPLALEQGVYTIQQKSNGRFMDAYESSGKDFSLVTRTAQNNDTQRWVIKTT